MTKRIKYYSDGETLVSIKDFLIENKRYSVLIDLRVNKFQIVDEYGIALYKGGNTRTGNVRVLKNQAKAALVKLGVKFETENRKEIK